ncbi:hypothetical protein [Psychroserpens sp. MEBiC05023]
MKVINVHKRLIPQPLSEVSQLFQTLATSEDKIWPKDNWPAMRFKMGLHIGSKGGHGRVRYTIIEFVEGQHIRFQFSKPDGFEGIHQLCIRRASESTTEIVHEINMITTTLKATLLWVFIIRWLHDALIEDAFDVVENQFTVHKKSRKYSMWVGVLRGAYKRQYFKINMLN